MGKFLRWAFMDAPTPILICAMIAASGATIGFLMLTGVFLYYDLWVALFVQWIAAPVWLVIQAYKTRDEE